MTTTSTKPPAVVDETGDIMVEAFAISRMVGTSVVGLDPPRITPGPAVWICTLDDGREITTDANGLVIGEGVGAKYGRELPVVEWRKVGEPSRKQMREALEAAFVYMDPEICVQPCSHPSCHEDLKTLALVRAALGKPGPT